MKCSFWKWNSRLLRSCSLAFVASLLLLGCHPKTNPPLTIATAASLRYFAEALIEDFELKTGQECQLVVGSTGKLTAQILAGAPFDVLLSADERYPAQIIQSGKAAEAPLIFARTGLVLWSKDTLAPLFLDQFGPKDQLAIANPATAPFGRLADSLLRLRPDFLTNVEARLVYGESIAQVNQFVTTGAVRYGLSAASVVEAAMLKNVGHWRAFGNEKIKQTAIVIKGGQEDKAIAFLEYLSSITDQL